MSKDPLSGTKELEPGKWVERYADYLYAFALSRLGRQEIAEDLVQDTFLAAWSARGNFQGNSSEKTWLTSIIKNKIVDHYRKSSTRNELSLSPENQNDDFINHFFEKAGTLQGHWTSSSTPREWKQGLKNEKEGEKFRKIFEKCFVSFFMRSR